jgi:hypothetical protein
MTASLRTLSAAAAIAAAALFSQAAPATAQQTAAADSDLWRVFYTDATFVVHFRSYYLGRDVPNGAPNLEALAAGGWLGYQTGWIGDAVRFGIVGYGSFPVSAPEDKDGTLLLRDSQRHYAVIGQAYVALKLWDQIITGYRQMVSEPEVNPQDNRMTPNTFEGISIAGELHKVDYYGAFLWAMKKRNERQFRDMSKIAGVAGEDRSMMLAGIAFTPIDDLRARFSSYYVPDVLWSNYGELTWMTPLTDQLKLKLAGQFMYQSSVGSDLITGSSFDTWAGGVKADLIWGPLTVSAGYTRIGDEANYRSPYGSWAGYTSMVVTDFNRAREEAFLLSASFDLTSLGLPGLSIAGYAVFGDGAIDPVTRNGVSDKTEYNVTVDYKLTAEFWPEALKSLWLRGRATWIDETTGGTTRTTKDYRVIVNYEWVFGKTAKK